MSSYIKSLFEELTKPYPIDEVKWRPGKKSGDKKSAMALCYVDARTVQDRLDDVIGPECWNCSFDHMPNGTIICTITFHIKDPDTGEIHHFSKADGAGQTDFEAEKGGLSDAFKRASVMFGLGRYLYSVDAGWATLSDKSWEPFSPQSQALLNAKLPNHVKKDDAAKKQFTKLTSEYRGLNERKALLNWGDANADKIQSLPESWQLSLRKEYKEWLQEIAA